MALGVDEECRVRDGFDELLEQIFGILEHARSYKRGYPVKRRGSLAEKRTEWQLISDLLSYVVSWRDGNGLKA